MPTKKTKIIFVLFLVLYLMVSSPLSASHMITIHQVSAKTGYQPKEISTKMFPLQENDTGVRVANASDMYINFHYQETSYSCGPASLWMLLSYYGFSVKEEYLREVANTVPNVGSYASDIVRAARFSVLSMAIQNSDLHGYPGRAIGFLAISAWDLTIDDLKKMIDMGYPVLVLMSYDYGAYGHFRVVKGYIDEISAFIVHDPWYNPSPYGGPNTLINYSVFSDLWRYSEHWGMIIFPFDVTIRVNEIGENVRNIDFIINYTVPEPFKYFAPTLYNLTLNISTTEGLTVDPNHITDGVMVGNNSIKIADILEEGEFAFTQFYINSTHGFNPADKIEIEYYGTITDSSYSYDSYRDYVGNIAKVNLIDTSKPGIDFDPDKRVINKTLGFRVYTYDDHGVNEVYAFWNEIGSLEPINKKAFLTGNITASIQIPRGNTYTELAILARDEAGNQNLLTQVLYIKDLPPLIQAPEIFTANKQGNLTIPVNVVDDFGLENVIVKFDTELIGTYNRSIKFVNITAEQGIHELLIGATDNKQQKTVKTTTVIYDYTQPELDIKIGGDQWILGNINIHIEATDNIALERITIKVDNTVAYNKTVEGKTLNLNYQKMIIGTHKVEVEIADKAGNNVQQKIEATAAPIGLAITITIIAVIGVILIYKRLKK
ncbi:MAG: C39 family peptidase [Candidatus Njordarchaeia archaeon]